MSLANILYPDNPKRRQTVISYQTKSRQSFRDFKGAWNDLCKLFNNAVQKAKPDWVLRLLEYDPDSHDSHDANYILNEIKEVLEDTQSKVPKIERDVGIKDLEGVFVKMDPEAIKNMTEFVEISIGDLTSIAVIPALGAIVNYLKPIVATVKAVLGNIGGLIGFILVGLVVGTAVIEAITGAIERKELENAIELFKKFDEDCIIHLNNARRKVEGINQNIKDGIYKVDDKHIIMNGKFIEVGS